MAGVVRGGVRDGLMLTGGHGKGQLSAACSKGKKAACAGKGWVSDLQGRAMQSMDRVARAATRSKSMPHVANECGARGGTRMHLPCKKI